MIVQEPDTTHYRSIWISDAHLGTRTCWAGRLLDFLRHHDSEHLYLVGDLVDGWQLKRSWRWTQSYNDVIQKVLRKVRKGTRVIYIPGNHDEFARDYESLQFGGITILKDAIHETANGKRLLVLHGDEFDGVVHYARWLAFLGSYGYDLILLLTYWINKLRRKTGVGQWSLAAFLKDKVKNIMKFISDYETALVREARKRGADGVICGHIHKADLREIDGVIYGNTGDWVESCSALVEREDGRLEIIHWFQERDYRQEDSLPSAAFNSPNSGQPRTEMG
jgi:UDP-2,3-diacylglucosamine pyrophosphatase LpxH